MEIVVVVVSQVIDMVLFSGIVDSLQDHQKRDYEIPSGIQRVDQITEEFVISLFRIFVLNILTANISGYIHAHQSVSFRFSMLDCFKPSYIVPFVRCMLHSDVMPFHQTRYTSDPTKCHTTAI